MIDPDAQFFAEHPDRQFRIRLPARELFKDRQRSVRYLGECELEFRHLGPHDARRRRIIIYRVPSNHPTHANHLMKIPILAYGDETISDDDSTLRVLVDGIMKQKAQQ